MPVRRFELVEGKSSKFWEVSVDGDTLTVTYGRIGTNGQTKEKAFASNAAALAEEAKLIREKTGKGYSELANAGTPAPATAAKPASAPKPPSPTAAPEQAETTEAPAGISADIDWPSGGFQWTDSLRAQLPIIRGIHAPRVEFTGDAWANPPSFGFENEYFENAVQELWNKLTQSGAVESGAPWTESEAYEQLTGENLRSRSPDFWRHLLMQCAVRQRYNNPKHLAWAIRVAIESHGLTFATEILLNAGEPVASMFPIWYGHPGDDFAHVLLRSAIAAAPDSDYQDARRVAEKFRGQTPFLDAVVSFFFPDIGSWAEECAAAHDDETTWWIDRTVLSIETAFRRYQAISSVYAPYVTPVALLQIHLHGDSAFPLLELLLDRVGDKDGVVKLLGLLTRYQIPAMLTTLLSRFENKEVRTALDKIAERWPAAVLKTAAELGTAKTSSALDGWIMRLALRFPEQWNLALAACSGNARERFTALVSARAEPEEAAADALPELLRNPPWLSNQRPEQLPVLQLAPAPQSPEMAWPAGLKESWAKGGKVPGWFTSQVADLRKNEPSLTDELHCLRYLDIKDSAFERLMTGQPLKPEDRVKKDYSYGRPVLLFVLPDVAATTLWNSLPPGFWYDYEQTGMPALMARLELKALPGLLTFASSKAEEGLLLALPFRCAEFAPIAAHALKNLKKACANAIAWLRAHAETAITALIPLAFGPDRVPRENAQYALRWLAQNGFEAELRTIAASYSEPAADAVNRLLAADPALMVPAKMPKLPAFFVPAAVRRPLLHSGGALPISAVEHLGRMLTISTLAEPYAGLESVKAACTRTSLAEFAWDLFEAWMSAGGPSKENWAFTALGLLGDDETARRLAPKIREWPGESAHARAVTGLDLLAAIGSDVALMHLNGIAAKVKFKGLQDKAKEKIAQVAEMRGFTTDELGDRLVPDLGLDDNGTVELDFGPRRFTVGFDETLKPFVMDSDGARLKDLPKPNKADDTERANQAVERYKGLKKDAKAIASLQIVRLELAMCARRRWSAADFRLFFLDHPLLRHLARRLVWGVYRDGAFVDAFRVAEDLSLAERSDDVYRIPEDAEVGLAHVLEMPADLLRDFGQIFGDYEILQPFKQLGRETYGLTEEERKTGVIQRFKDKKVATGSVMGLINRGWIRGQAQDAGWIGWFTKPLPDELEAELQLDPGTIVGDLSFEPEQAIPSIGIRRRGTWGQDGLVNIAGLDPIIVSEIIRDADLLAPIGR